MGDLPTIEIDITDLHKRCKEGKRKEEKVRGLLILCKQ
jgi:hypothetical protein